MAIKPYLDRVGLTNLWANIKAYVTSRVPTKVSELTNDSGYITGVSWNNVSGKPSTFTPSSHTHAKSDITDFPTLATVATSGSYTDLSNKPTIPVIDSTLNATSTNGLQNKVIKTALDGKANSSHTHTKSQITDFPTLATVATSGSYNDLSNKPTIPTVNNATLTIQKNGSNVQTFTANVSNSLQEAKNYVDTTTSNMVTTDTTQTIPGNKAFSGALDYLVPIKLSDIPTANTYKHFRFLDKDGLRLFSLQYCSRPNGSRDAILYVYDKDGGSHGLNLSTDNCVIPTMRDTVSLGTSGTKWLSVYATNFYGDYGSFSNKVEAPLVRATADLGLVLAKKDSKAPTTTSGWNQVEFYDKNMVQLGYFQLSSSTNANIYYWKGTKNANLADWRNIFWNVDVGVFGCDPSNTVKLGSSSNKWAQLHCTEITTYGSNFLRSIYGDYGTFWRNDGNNLYLLITAKGDQTGNFTTARPIQVSLSTGICNINGNANSATYATTQAASDNSTKIATTAFVKSQGYVSLTSLAGGNRAGSLTHSVGSMILARCASSALGGTKFYTNVAGQQLYPCRTEIYTVSRSPFFWPIVVHDSSDGSVGSGTWRYLGGSNGNFNTDEREIFGMFLRVA